MDNVRVKKNEDKEYEVRWTSNNEKFTMTLDETMNVEALIHKIDKPLQMATFCSGMVELYYPGLSQVVRKIVKEYIKLEEQKAKINYVPKKKVPEIRALLKSDTPTKIKKESSINIVEPKPNTKNTKENLIKEAQTEIKKEHKQETPSKPTTKTSPKTPAIKTIKSRPVMTKEISYIKLNFLHNKPLNTPENKKLCDICKAVCRIETINDNKEDTTYLCPLCFSKKERIHKKKY
ncbi:hypothetical protein [Bacillus bombysepticus]|uniref:hypothetical protein n=1 Tax=Bacillus bombysepticus TaxID=658666 RepID=UPI0030170AB3